MTICCAVILYSNCQLSIVNCQLTIVMTIDEYILQHIDDEGDYLKALYRDTHLKLLYPRMASGHLQGRMLKMFVKMIRPHRILEIGTYSGYSALCLAEGLPEDGMLYTFEINDEQEDFTRPWLEGSEYADKIKLYIGDALQLVPQLGVTFDLAFIDGDKRKYVDYYEWCFPILPTEVILSLTILCGTTMYWKIIPATMTYKPSVSRLSMNL